MNYYKLRNAYYPDLSYQNMECYEAKPGIKSNVDGQLTVMCEHGDMYNTKNFDICVTSHIVANKMNAQKQVEDMCKFVKMEDKFLGLEKEAVKEQKDMGDEMEKLHKYMKSELEDVDLSYHSMHIKQGRNPDEKINMAMHIRRA